ncbi:hypothetical protein [Amycolatopsis echigonensis]|uniref:hypothetical protein n=1 Tax=Amycolatopsis echigonensis TaxID=2576905 RepID=UPI001ABF0C59|nr:hypothetical protein [Amycolatopsis niigatensis]
MIAVPATGNWCWENWSVARELGLLVPGQHGDADANAFAADLLLPAPALARVDWVAISDTGLADLVWNLGVSVAALAQRLDRLTGSVPARIRAWADQPVQRLLRRHGEPTP